MNTLLAMTIQSDPEPTAIDAVAFKAASPFTLPDRCALSAAIGLRPILAGALIEAEATGLGAR